MVDEYDKLRLLVTNLSKRSIRSAPDDEFQAFARWVGRIPQRVGFSYRQVI